MLETHVEVLVIGAGPTGLFTAAELARHGVRPRIIDKCPAPHTQTRATGIQPAALEVLHRAGLAERFLAESVPVRGLRVFDHRMEEAFGMTSPTLVRSFRKLWHLLRSLPHGLKEPFSTTSCIPS